MAAVLWCRRDLRLHDNPALTDAAETTVTPVWIADPDEQDRLGRAQAAYLPRSLAAFNEQLDGHLAIRHGAPETALLEVAREVGATRVVAAHDYTPHGKAVEQRVTRALEAAGITVNFVGDPYAVRPGTLLTGAGRPFQVFTPFGRVWRQVPVQPVLPPPRLTLRAATSEPLAVVDPPAGMQLPVAGEVAARARWQAWLPHVVDYDTARDFPATPSGTSGVSVALRWGELHPRTLLADLTQHRSPGTATYVSELAWREFFADQLHRRPEAETEPLRPEFSAMVWDQPTALIEAWKHGRTGFSIVDAGMRELAATGHLHNRVRMIVASFLVKDLHVDWRVGAAHFRDLLLDHDDASNALNWQWVAGCGTDAAPYFRVFNPHTQAAKFDPSGAYIRRWVPEVDTADYPAPVVDHAQERDEALRRWRDLKAPH